MSYDSYSDPQSEALLRTAQERYTDAHTRRTLITELIAAAGFLVAAVAVALLAPAGRILSLPALCVTGVAFLAARRVQFQVGPAYTFPTQLIFIPMLFLLPLPWVPLIVVGIMLLQLAPRQFAPASASKRAARTAVCIADAWYTLGPVAILIVFSAQHFAWSNWPVYVLALVAQNIVDIVAALLRTWFADHIVPSAQAMLMWVYLTDAALSCVGLQLAAVAVHGPGLILLELPMIGLFGMFARERKQRLAGTLALSTAYRGTALLLGDVIEGDDEYTGVHSKAVVDLSIAVADRIGLDASARQRVEFGALLHDVGKIRVPKEILHKPGALDAEEWAIMRRHTVYGEEMLRQVGGTLGGVGRVVRHSHEHWNGGGYPDGLSGAEIPIESRIITTCDAFNAMTTDRPYRRAMTVAQAIAELQRCSGTQFDPAVVDALLAEVGAARAVAAREIAASRGSNETQPQPASDAVSGGECASRLLTRARL